jgi:hypothetical protein
MYLLAIGWLYVVVLMALAEGAAPGGSWLGAAVTFVFYGLVPLSVALYLYGTPSRRRARRRAELASARDRGAGADPDGSGHPPGDPVAPIGKEP